MFKGENKVWNLDLTTELALILKQNPYCSKLYKLTTECSNNEFIKLLNLNSKKKVKKQLITYLLM